MAVSSRSGPVGQDVAKRAEEEADTTRLGLADISQILQEMVKLPFAKIEYEKVFQAINRYGAGRQYRE